MTTTGWSGEDAERPAMPLAAQLLRNRERGPGDTLAISQARGRAAEARELREEAAAAVDPDERAANLIGRGVTPGMISDLGRRLADAEGELAAEREKIEKGERVNARVSRMLERGQVGGLEASRMMDGDYGDAARAEKLERRADRLRQQLASAQMMIAPQREQPADPLEAASRHAHEVFREVTRQRMAEAQAGTARREPRPFAYASRSGVPGEVTCADCVKYGATAEQSYMIHADPDAPAGVRLPVAELTEADLAEFGRQAGIPYRSRTHKVPVPESYGVVIRDGGPILGVR
jgi:hypothetical protein